MSKSFILLLTGLVVSFAAFGQDLSNPRRQRKVRPGASAMKKTTPLPIIPAAPAASAEAKSGDIFFRRFYFSGGFHTEFYNNIQTNPSGGLRQFETAPTLGLGAVGGFESGLKLLPEVNWVLPFSNADKKILRNLFMLRGDLAYDPVNWFRIRAGTSLMWLNQHGSGGSAKINNGNSTSIFYYPDENRSSLNNTLDFGGELLLENFSVRLQSYVYSAFREERRLFSYTLFLSYYWDR